eukprot:gnl/MRDRNA2_/MRDRNA2_83310_c0_seq1.p1 gnl/MRDRNA2_/MRDRNA2_83310_c0~~gnl/MRDRNA2_/MRDRNA2_83310_c0_seq1.p1  ORF type:complete len:340 (-),score=67.94 gnl/MRDRNA2_/MRDRNA2_83310_c0_seq1:12-986(-)
MSSAEGEEENAVDVTILAESDRERMWWAAMTYGVERALMVSALEAATSLILEIEFGWDINDVGLAVGLTFLLGLPVTLLLDLGRKNGMISETKLLTGLAITVVTSSVFFFPNITLAFGASGLPTVVIILMADCLIFSSGFFANGILDGFAVQCSVPGTVCSLENINLIDAFGQDTLARLTGPALARYLTSSHGRGAYSILQLCVSSLGCLTCLSVVSQLQSLQQLKETRLAAKVQSKAKLCKSTQEQTQKSLLLTNTLGYGNDDDIVQVKQKHLTQNIQDPAKSHSIGSQSTCSISSKSTFSTTSSTAGDSSSVTEHLDAVQSS